MARKLYQVTFIHQGSRYEIYAHSVGASGIFGFVEVAEFSFNSRDSLVVDPTQEQLEREFSHIERTHIPLQSILRIDEVSRQGSAKITTLKQGDTGNVTPLHAAQFHNKGND